MTARLGSRRQSKLWESASATKTSVTGAKGQFKVRKNLRNLFNRTSSAGLGLTWGIWLSACVTVAGTTAKPAKTQRLRKQNFFMSKYLVSKKIFSQTAEMCAKICAFCDKGVAGSLEGPEKGLRIFHEG